MLKYEQLKMKIIEKDFIVSSHQRVQSFKNFLPIIWHVLQLYIQTLLFYYIRGALTYYNEKIRY